MRIVPDCPLVLIMGSDQFARSDTWRRWDEIIETAHIAVARRAGTSLMQPNAIVQAEQTGEARSLAVA